MPHLIGQLSLLHGWLPVFAQALALLVAINAIQWRRRALLLAPPVAVAVTALSYRYIASIGVAGDPAPVSLWLWIAMTGLSAAVLLLGWPRVRWWRRGLSMLAVPLCALCVALALNVWVGYFPTVHAAWNQLTAGPLPHQTDRLTVTAMQVAGTKPSTGVVVPVTIDAAASGFQHRQELVYLPPAWFATNPPPPLPAVLMIGAAINTPADWLRAGNAIDTVDAFAARHQGYAPALVFVDATGAFDNDTECVNGSRGKAADHLTKDVVPFMISNFGVSADRANWGIAGWSMGGTCAVDVTVTHPELFSAFVDIAGDLRPNLGSKDQTVARLFGGSRASWAAFDPVSVITRHGHYAGVSGWFDVVATSGPRNVARAAGPALGSEPPAGVESEYSAAHSLCDLAAANGITCAVASQPGKHDWPFAAQAFATSLPWLAAALGTPDTEPVRLPQGGAGTPH